MKKIIQKALPKLLNVLLGIGMIVWLLNPAEVLAANISFQENAVTNISNNDARISAKVINSDKLNVTETGFYLGTSSGALSKCSKNDSGSWKYSKITVGYTMSQYWGALSENTTYYYRFYVIANGVEYTSGEYSFKTTGGSAAKTGLSFYGNNVTDVTENNGRINAKISNPDGRRVTETGFYIGTSQNLSKNGMNDQCNLTNTTITVGYTMSKYYGELQPGTTYYYKFYAIGDGEEFFSEVYSFTTVSKPEPTPTPEPTPEPAPAPTPTPDTKPQNSKAKLTFYDNSVTELTANNGRINAKISNPDGRRVTETGFYIGTSEPLYQNAKHDDCDYSNTTITVGYTMSKYYGTLEPGTTYYYMFYAVGDGEEFFSDIYYFTTAKAQPSESQTNPGSGNGGTTEAKSKISFSVTEAKDITHETARIGAKVNNPDKEKITETGFYYGTSKSDLTKSLKTDTGNWKTGISISYDVGEYARICLMENTTYYYQFYVVSEGKEVVSEVYSFMTAPKKEQTGGTSDRDEELDNSNNYDNEDTDETGNSQYGQPANNEKKTYTIKLDANGGNISPQSIQAVDGEVYGNLPVPTKKGYIFDGWYREVLFWKEKITEDTVYNKLYFGIGNTLKAKWREKQVFIVKFDGNGGKVTENLRQVYEQDALGNLPGVSRAGYDFAGWYTETVGGEEVFANRSVKGNEVYYAQWKSSKPYKHIFYNDAKDYLINQKGSTDCAIASMATVESYFQKTINNIYETIYKKVGGPSSNMDWTKAGYIRYNTNSLETLYKALQTGPCIVGRTGHYSVVIGYVGNEEELELSGFRVMEVKAYNLGNGNYGFNTSWYKNYDYGREVPLNEWLKKGGNSEVKQITIRDKGI